MNVAALTPSLAIGVAWLVWFASWLAAAWWTRATVRHADYLRQAPPRFVVLIGGVLLFVSLATGLSYFPDVWETGAALGWVLFAAVLAGMAFAWWARVRLGALWSGSIARKEGHHIIDSGPYAIVRHPIYTGALFSMWMTALQLGRVEALAGAAVCSIGLWMQARAEERFLAQELGAEAYARYSARVPMLVPTGRRT